MAGKRGAEASPTVPPRRKEKKQKTTTSTPTTSTAHTSKIPSPQKPKQTGSIHTVVPATPGTIVDLPAKDKPNKPDSSEKQKSQKKSHEPPSTLPLEPHAAILAQLRPKYAVRVLSVISSTRMEKRIKTILDHLAAAASTGTSVAALPGVVLLHARAPDANKLVSIAEIVKRRIREGHFEEAAAPAGGIKKKKANGAHASAVVWYQYDRIYDVKSARKKKGAAGDDDEADAEEDGDGQDDGFEPMMHRLESALGGSAHGSGPVVTTYMSIMLSRTPLLELHKNPDITVQCSADPLEVEYEEYMAGA